MSRRARHSRRTKTKRTARRRKTYGSRRRSAARSYRSTQGLTVWTTSDETKKNIDPFTSYEGGVKILLDDLPVLTVDSLAGWYKMGDAEKLPTTYPYKMTSNKENKTEIRDLPAFVQLRPKSVAYRYDNPKVNGGSLKYGDILYVKDVQTGDDLTRRLTAGDNANPLIMIARRLTPENPSQGTWEMPAGKF